MTQYTPGPWEIDEDGYLFSKINHVRICRIAEPSGGEKVLHGQFCTDSKEEAIDATISF